MEQVYDFKLCKDKNGKYFITVNDDCTVVEDLTLEEAKIFELGLLIEFYETA